MALASLQGRVTVLGLELVSLSLVGLVLGGCGPQEEKLNWALVGQAYSAPGTDDWVHVLSLLYGAVVV